MLWLAVTNKDMLLLNSNTGKCYSSELIRLNAITVPYVMLWASAILDFLSHWRNLLYHSKICLHNNIKCYCDKLSYGKSSLNHESVLNLNFEFVCSLVMYMQTSLAQFPFFEFGKLAGMVVYQLALTRQI